MPSRAGLKIIGSNNVPKVEDINILYRLLNGDFDTKKGNGMAVRLTAFDGIMSTGVIDAAKYALEVRNRESTQQRTAAFRRADNLIVAEVAGGLLKAVDPSSAAPTTTAQVIVHGTPAGGVLGGTYPNPSFATLTEYYRVYPTMIVAWYGDPTTVTVGGQQELRDAPGWVHCQGGTFTLRSGGAVTTPDMRERFPLGVGGSYTKGATAGNTMAQQGAISTSHDHDGGSHTHPHNHPHHHVHNHSTPNHTHTVASHGHTHTHTVPVHYHNHDHTITHVHGMNSHVHGSSAMTAAAHHHLITTHSHAGNGHSHNVDNHSHTIPDHQHTLLDHDHTAGSYETVAGETSGFEDGSPATVLVRDDGSPTERVANNNHYHQIGDTPIDGESGSAHYVSGGADFNGTQDKTGLSTASKTGLSTQGDSTITGGITSVVDTGDNAASAISGSTDAATGNTAASSAANTGATTDGTGPPSYVGPVTSATSQDTTTHGPVSTNSGVGEGASTTGDSTAVDNNSDSAAYDGTGATYTTSTSTDGPTIDATPPLVAWYWIMKL